MRGRQVNPDFFNKEKQRSGHEQSIASTSSLTKKFQQARREGHLNLSSVKPSLLEIPSQVFHLDAALEEGEKFWEIEPLRSLDISFNAITFIPPDIGNLTTCHTIKARSNKLTGPLPPSMFTECTALRILDLSQNELTPSLPEEIGRLEELRELSLSTNKLVNVPQSMFYLPNLRTLDLSHNQLRELPPGLSCATLVTLNLAHNKLQLIPSLAVLKSLETLNCASNQLQLLPDLSNLAQLKSIDASQNHLTDFPLLPRRQSKLNQLVLSYNHLTSIDMNALELQSHLSELLIHNNMLTILPPELEALQALKVLDVSNNELQDIPATLGYIASLQILRLEGNRIKTIRQTMLQKNCQEIKTYLRTRGPSLVHPHETEEDGLASATTVPRGSSATASAATVDNTIRGLQRRGQTDLSTESSSTTTLAAASAAAAVAHARTKLVNNLTFRLRDINGGVLDLSKLQLQDSSLLEVLDILAPYPSVHTVKTLQLQQNQFRQLPYPLLAATETLFTDLKHIQLAHNLLGEISRSFTRDHEESAEYAEWSQIMWTQITGIDIGYNKLNARMVDLLCTMPMENIWRFPNLSELNLEHNPLGEIPLFLQTMSFGRGTTSTIRRLQLNGCQLRSLTDEELDFRIYIHLNHLDLSENHLSSLPTSITSASRLQFLSIENNDFKEIPSVLGVLPALQSLLIQGNPQRLIRTNIIQQGSVKIIQYLREKHLPPEPVGATTTSIAPPAAAVGNVGANKRAPATTTSRRVVEEEEQYGGQSYTSRIGSDVGSKRPGSSTSAMSSQRQTPSSLPVRREYSGLERPAVPQQSYQQPRRAANEYDYDDAYHQQNAQSAPYDSEPPLQRQSSTSLSSGIPIRSTNRPPVTSSAGTSTSLAQALRMRQECTPSVAAYASNSSGATTAIAPSSAATASSSSTLISARVKARNTSNSNVVQSQKPQSYGGGRSDPSAYW